MGERIEGRKRKHVLSAAVFYWYAGRHEHMMRLEMGILEDMGILEAKMSEFRRAVVQWCLGWEDGGPVVQCCLG